jgi:hypothetical protein
MSLSIKAARGYLFSRGWPVRGRDLREEFPDGLPATVPELHAWAERTLPAPFEAPAAAPRTPGMTAAAAATVLRGLGYSVTPGQIVDATRDGSLRLTRDGRLLEGELRSWARRALGVPVDHMNV